MKSSFTSTLAGQPVQVQTAGQGQTLVLALHGFGQEGMLYDFLADRLLPGQRLLAPDLPWFGQSPFPTIPQGIPSTAWNAWFQELISAYPETKRIHLLGYSLGARVALHLYTHASIPVTEVLLMAPDGIRLHPLYRFCINNPLGRFMFRTTLKRPGAFLFLLRSLYNLKALDAARYRWVRRLMENQAERERLGNVWLGYRQLRWQGTALTRQAQAWESNWTLVWGEKDKVIRPRNKGRFFKALPKAQVKLLPEGHRLLPQPTKGLIELIDNILNKK